MILSMVRQEGTKNGHGSSRLHEIDEEWAGLRRKSVILEEGIRKMKIGIAQTGYTNL